ncbi:hypothetical protein Q0Z83_036400 [Actinoplanes sichuanensis]|uniref:Restriction endonuclease n=1 Tax=Actinoplanes sichuanensis TaxID=512349 RepID=A0ABW4ATV6_9ACTN|nr:hypothetical protein [Actinoplanes sichuanensis]BEL05449.1 hypothetical protein Q0Z83_036400 [Actinoplanes sichuanensis]
MRVKVQDLLTELDTNLAGIRHPYTSASSADRIYEVYAFSMVISAAVKAGGEVRYYAGSQYFAKEVKDLEFRGAPGVIHAPNQRWTFATLNFGVAPLLEVHLRVKIVGGRTKTEGECDILILDHHAAGTSRAKRQSPAASKCLAVIECKFYSTTLPVALGREFANLCRDRGQRLLGYFVSNQTGPQAWKTLAAEPNAICEFGVRPGDPRAQHLETLLREAFKRHVVLYDPDHVV